MGNLSCKVSRNALWDAFNQYGRVVDVFISLSEKQGKSRSFMFAFVRYKWIHEALKAIKEGNDKKIDGKIISVKKALSRGTSNPKLDSINFDRDSCTFVRDERCNHNTIRDGKSYRDVLMGFKQHGELNKIEDHGDSR
ncbi:hypothetical protein REPUB_Repub15cG0070000 [Reevesia pubescens]